MKTNIEKFNNLPQRQKKYARTKVALLNALLDELKSKPLSSIMIKELAFKAEVSEPTFFNYFESKQHMLIYFIQMWSIQMNALAKECESQATSYLEIIKDIFRKASYDIVSNPQIMLEIISFQAQENPKKPHNINDAEKWYFFQDVNDVENLNDMGLESILPPLIQKSIERGELDKTTDAQLLFLTLSSLFFGTSLLLLKSNPQALPSMLEKEIDLIFQGRNDET